MDQPDQAEAGSWGDAGGGIRLRCECRYEVGCAGLDAAQWADLALSDGQRAGKIAWQVCEVEHAFSGIWNG